MAHLIDKDALVAEIERLVNNQDSVLDYEAALEDVRNFIDTLKVKEVDLEKYYHEFLQKEWFGNSHVRTVSEMMAFTAKHFFELGLNAQQK